METYCLNIGFDGYYPFGKEMPGRQFSPNSYRFSFNGKEDDNETNSQDYGWRWYNNDLGRFWSVDPASADFSMLSPYEFAGNTPIWAMDIGGLQAWLTNDGPNPDISLEDWRNFVTTELQVIFEKQLKLDCADFALYLLAKYHQARGLELSYTHPISKKTISSNDAVFSDFDGFFFGLADGGRSFDGYGRSRADLQFGFKGAFGAGNIQLLAMRLRASQIGNGDFYSSGIHVSVAFPNNGYDEDVTLDPFVIYSGSNPARVPKISVVVDQESLSNPLYRFNFLNGLPYRTVETMVQIDIIQISELEVSSPKPQVKMEKIPKPNKPNKPNKPKRVKRPKKQKKGPKFGTKKKNY